MEYRPLFALALAAVTSVGCAAPIAKLGCTSNVDCKVGSYCHSGNCETDCRGDFDCPGARCDPGLGKCVAAVDGGAPDLATNDPADLATVEDFALAPDDLATGPAGSYGEVCTMDGDCQSMICSSNPFAKGDHECTGPCNAGCMLGDFCVGNLTCAQSDIGASCNQNMGGKDCRGAACLGAQGQPNTSFCTLVCQSAADCPASYSCSDVSGTRVCVNLDATTRCQSDNDCIYSTYCDIVGMRCLGDCRTNADCPLEHACNGQIGNHLVCVPKSPGGGGVESACQEASDCRSGACYMNKCANHCSVLSSIGQWCPGGYGCNPLSDGMGGFVLLCVDAGTGSLATPCVDNNSCASGLCVDMPGYCTRFCNSAPCPKELPHCVAVGVVADGVNLMACSK